MRIPTFHLVLTLIIGGVVLAGCGNVRSEREKPRVTRDAKTDKSEASDKTDDKAEGGKTADAKTDVTLTAAKAGTDEGTKKGGEQPIRVAQAPTKAEKAEDDMLEPNRSELVLPTGDKSSSLLAVETITPKRHQIDRDYNYEIHVTNVSDQSKRNVALANVRVTQLIRGKMTISDSKVSMTDKAKQAVTGRRQQTTLPSGGEDASAVWTIGLLEPGDRAVITVTAKGSERGPLVNYVSVQYDPLLRLETEITESVIRLTKTGPKSPIDNCRKIEYTYVLKNEGNEAVKDLTLEDKLDRGLKTAGGDAEAGKEVVTLKHDRLEGGAEKKWTVIVEASQPGTYKSQAVVTWPGVKGTMTNGAKMSEWRKESETVATQVRLGKLKIAVQPDFETQYKGQKLTYSVTVTNQGDAKVDQPQVAVTLDKAARRADSAASGNTWKLLPLEPGKTSAPIQIAVRSNTPGKLESKFEASFDCDGRPMKNATSVTSIIKPLDLAVAVLPSQSQVEQGESFTCSLQVSNNGASPDSDLKLSLKLPEFIAYEGIEGDSQATYDAKTRTVTLAAISQLESGESRPLRVRVKAEKAGQGQFAAVLSSAALGGASLAFESEPVTGVAKKAPAKAPIEAPQPKPEKTPATKAGGDVGKPKPTNGDKSKPAAEKAEPNAKPKG
jgi:hypothetical protein